MLKLKDVVKIRIMTTEKHRKDLIRSLYSFGLVQVVSAMEPQYDKPLAEYSQISDALVYLRGLIKKYDLGAEPSPNQGEISELRTYADQYADIKATLSAFEQKIAEAREKHDRALALSKLCCGFEGYGQSFSDFFPSGVLSPRVVLLQPGSKHGVEKLISSLYKTDSVILENKVDDSDTAPVALIYDSHDEPVVLSAVGTEISLLAGPYQVYRTDTFRVLCDSTRSTEALSAKYLDHAEKALEAHLLANRQKYLDLVSRLETLSSLTTLPLKFTKAEKLLIVEGWVPQDIYARLERELNSALGNVVQVNVLETKENPPTLMDNPQVARPFEYLMRFFSIPSTGEIDPTILIAVTFPLFFGLILGDIGYGILGLIIALYVQNKYKTGFWGDFSRIMVLSSIASIAFGFVFAEFFGKEEIFGFVLHPMIARVTTAGTATMIMVSLVIGAVHVFLGFVLGAINGYLHHDRHHMWAKACWAVFEVSAIFLYLSLSAPGMLDGLPVGLVLNVSAALLALSLLGILKFEGIAGGIEIFSLVSNIFSYLRLIALGLSGAILAMVINQIPVDIGSIWAMFTGAQPFDTGAIIGVVLFAIIFLVGHAMALLLALFECSIQALRLHYVEFFSKFYRGGGSAFLPLRQVSPRGRRGLDRWNERQYAKKSKVENRYLHRGVM